MSTPLSFVARVERVKDALGMTGIVGAGPIIAAAAELMGVALSDSATLPDKLAAVEGEVFSMDAGVGGLALGRGQGRVIS